MHRPAGASFFRASRSDRPGLFFCRHPAVAGPAFFLPPSCNDSTGLFFCRHPTVTVPASFFTAILQ
ncbi:hypothetical protein DLD77_00105 [Chitinophaga alhagiae]|uniref:Uncharacterized protein n=1 Tax=Chitinophaga alhagiae TaxID=2203219 RepID=A0ABM6W8C3_9BACT|nr:hypothetical protein DLD77_00105 [Chitinophaga alhagiae]